MKVSILLPSLYPVLANRLIEGLLRATKPEWLDFEIVVVSKDKPHWTRNVVWVPETIPGGNNQANRIAFNSSYGDWILPLADDVIALSNVWFCIGDAINVCEENTVVAMDGGAWECFKRRYAPLPLCHRQTVENHFWFFYPYRAHWGDVAFSMDVWRRGGKVVGPPASAFVWGDRMGQPESHHKLTCFGEDYRRFCKDFEDLAVGYDLNNFQSFNHPS